MGLPGPIWSLLGPPGPPGSAPRAARSAPRGARSAPRGARSAPRAARSAARRAPGGPEKHPEGAPEALWSAPGGPRAARAPPGGPGDPPKHAKSLLEATKQRNLQCFVAWEATKHCNLQCFMASKALFFQAPEGLKHCILRVPAFENQKKTWISAPGAGDPPRGRALRTDRKNPRQPLPADM